MDLSKAAVDSYGRIPDLYCSVLLPLVVSDWDFEESGRFESQRVPLLN